MGPCLEQLTFQREKTDKNPVFRGTVYCNRMCRLSREERGDEVLTEEVNLARS